MVIQERTFKKNFFSYNSVKTPPYWPAQEMIDKVVVI